jgi:hypothetical protein
MRGKHGLVALMMLSILALIGSQGNAQVNDPGPASVAQDTRAVAEAIVAHAEAASGRTFDAGFRAAG